MDQSQKLHLKKPAVGSGTVEHKLRRSRRRRRLLCATTKISNCWIENLERFFKLVSVLVACPYRRGAVLHFKTLFNRLGDFSVSLVRIWPKHTLFVFILVSLRLCLNVSVCFSLFYLASWWSDSPRGQNVQQSMFRRVWSEPSHVGLFFPVWNVHVLFALRWRAKLTNVSFSCYLEVFFCVWPKSFVFDDHVTTECCSSGGSLNVHSWFDSSRSVKMNESFRNWGTERKTWVSQPKDF